MGIPFYLVKVGFSLLGYSSYCNMLFQVCDNLFFIFKMILWQVQVAWLPGPVFFLLQMKLCSFCAKK
jgi:hypothetical protein